VTSIEAPPEVLKKVEEGENGGSQFVQGFKTGCHVRKSAWERGKMPRKRDNMMFLVWKGGGVPERLFWILRLSHTQDHLMTVPILD